MFSDSQRPSLTPPCRVVDGVRRRPGRCEEVLKLKDVERHAAAPARRAASTTAAAFGGSSSIGISGPPSPRARPNSCFRYHSGTPVDTSDHGMIPFGSIAPR